MSITKKITCIFVIFATVLSLSACDMPIKIIGSIPEPRDTVTGFFDSVCAGDFKKSDKYLSGMSLSMKKDIEGHFASKLYDYLVKSYAYQINGDVVSSQLDAECKVDFTYLDLNLLSDDLKARSTQLGKRYIAENKEGYVEEKDGAINLTDSGAEKIAEEALDDLMKNSEKYCSTKTFDITLKYSGGKWLISLTDELFEAISGGFDLDAQ